MWKQSLWFGLLGSVIAVLSTAVDTVSLRGESFTVFGGGSTFVGMYRGSAWAELGPTAVAGVVLGAAAGLVLYGCGIRATAPAGHRTAFVALAGVLGAALGLSPVLLMLNAAINGLQTGESWAIEPAYLLVLYGVCAVLAYCASLLSIWLSLRVIGDELTRRTTRCTALLLPLGTIAATACGVGAAWLQDFTTTSSTATVVVVAVTSVLSATFALARAWALRSRREHAGTVHPSVTET